MKQIFILLAAMLAFSTTDVKAQYNIITPGSDFTIGTNPFSTVSNVLVDGATITKEVSIPNRWQFVTFQVDMKDSTGDPSGVVLNIYNSADKTGDKWDSTPLFSDTMPNENHTVVRTIEGNPTDHYKLELVGAGTHVSTYTFKVFVR